MKKIILISALLLLPFLLFSEDEIENEENYIPPGLIFNAQNILLDLDSFQSGIGYKYFINKQKSLRFLFDIYYSNSLNTFSGTLGASYIRYFKLIRRINPYTGGFIDFSYLGQSNIIDDNNWSKTQTIPMSGGVLLGVEFFIFDFLSVFAEYNARINLSIEMSQISNDATITKTPTQYSTEIDTGIGNNSSLGLVVYFDKVIRLDKN